MPDLITIFLDANVLARPVTRTLLIAGGPTSGFVAVFSRTALDEADRHLGPGKTPVTDLVTRFGWATARTGTVGDRFDGTDPKDRQLLADAVDADAAFLVTDDVDDYAEHDLIEAGVAAVSADVFLAHRLTGLGYLAGLDALSAGRTRPPRTPEELHVALGRQHPRLVAAQAEAFATAPAAPTHPEPAVVYRGARCLACLAVDRTVNNRGLCSSCVVVVGDGGRAGGRG